MLRSRSVRRLLSTGLLLGGVITAGLTVMVLQDRTARLESASRQSLALATGTSRLLHFELRNIERALTGIAADAEIFSGAAPDHAERLFAEAIAGVASRHPELESLTALHGTCPPPPSSDRDVSVQEPVSGMSGIPGKLQIGALQRSGDKWLLPLALCGSAGEGVGARLRLTELEGMIDGLDIGRDGSATILDSNGLILARHGSQGGFVGRDVALPPGMPGQARSFLTEITSELDRIERLAALSSNSGYPLIVAVGLSKKEVLVPWLKFAVLAAVLIALYWSGLLFMIRRTSVSESARDALLYELETNAHWLSQTQIATGTGVWRIEADGSQVQASENATLLFGFAPATGPIPLESFFERLHPHDRDRVVNEFEAARSSGEVFDSEYRILLPDGGERWISARGAMVTDTRGQRRMTGTIVDITERRDAQARVVRAELQFRQLFERNPLPFWVFDVATLRFLAVNDAALETYGYSRAEFLAMTILDIRPSEDSPMVRDSISRRDGDQDAERIWTHVTRDGSRLHVRVRSGSIEFAGTPARLVLAEDVSLRIAYERDLAWRATHDTTTGLRTAQALIEEIDALCQLSSDLRYAIAYVQLRDLELVAPTLGRRAGEAILRDAAARFGRIGDDYGLVAYVPAESFVIVALDARRRDAMVASLLDAIRAPVEVEGGLHPLEAWIGLADGPCDGSGMEKVLGHAALAALQARRDNIAVVPYDAPMAAQASERLALVGRLRNSLERGDFELVFQPIHAVADGRLMALEALLRWPQADGSLVSPMQFIPLCEESGLIVPLGAWVFEQAAHCHGKLAARGLGAIPIAINVSPVQFLAEGLPESLRELHIAHGLPRGALQIELTESVLLRRPDAARALMGQLRDEGMRISIDDFGTGFSSMAYLRDLPLDYLKIDRTFVADVHCNASNASICLALIALGHGLGLHIIAEGVESAAQLDWLRAHGCDQAQGFHFAAPAPIEVVLAMIEERALGVPV